MFTANELEWIELSRRTGTQDAWNAFDGDAVPTVEELTMSADDVRETAEFEGCSPAAVDACVAAWVATYREEAARIVAVRAEKYPSDDA